MVKRKMVFMRIILRVMKVLAMENEETKVLSYRLTVVWAAVKIDKSEDSGGSVVDDDS